MEVLDRTDRRRRPGRVGALASLGPRGEAVVGVRRAGRRPCIETDPVLLERVVANLVDNALLHGGGHGRAGGGRDGGRTGRPPGHRPRTGHPPAGPRPGLPAVPTPGRLRQPGRRGPGPRRVPRLRRGGRRRAGPRGHPRRRLHHGGPAAGARVDRTRRPSSTPTSSPTCVGARDRVRTTDRPAAGPDRPRPRRADASAVAEPRTAWHARRGPEGDGEHGTRVLVFDDDPSLLRALTISLGARGYEVIGGPDRRGGTGPGGPLAPRSGAGRPRPPRDRRRRGDPGHPRLERGARSSSCRPATSR